jgi:FkbM family methyltransferase
MRRFSTIEGLIRSNFFTYRVIRKFAPFICKWVSLEEGFDFLNLIEFDANAAAIDVGANDGTSIRMILRLAPGAKIVSFDPVKLPNFKHKLVSLENFALGSESGIIEIATPVVDGFRLTQYSSSFKENMIKQLQHDLRINEYQIAIEMNEVTVKKGDDLNLIPFFMKIDVEGAEQNVIKGSLRTIHEYKPIILVEIQNEYHYQQILSLLGPLDYFSVNLAKIRKGSVPEMGYNENYNNYIWVSRVASPTWSFKS